MRKMAKLERTGSGKETQHEYFVSVYKATMTTILALLRAKNFSSFCSKRNSGLLLHTRILPEQFQIQRSKLFCGKTTLATNPEPQWQSANRLFLHEQLIYAIPNARERSGRYSTSVCGDGCLVSVLCPFVGCPSFARALANTNTDGTQPTKDTLPRLATYHTCLSHVLRFIPSSFVEAVVRDYLSPTFHFRPLYFVLQQPLCTIQAPNVQYYGPP